MDDNYTHAPSEATPPKDSSPGCVLLVDDVPANLRLLAGILKIEGFKTVSAQSGREALEILQQEDAEQIDVVLLDVMMPDMDGFEVCERIRQISPIQSVPVVMVTALQDVTDRVRALEVGADDFLTKPVEETEVVTRVRSLVRAKRDRAALAKAYQELKAAEELRHFLSEMLVHDLRTPLTTVMASLNLLQTGMAGHLSDLQLEVTEMCIRGSEHLLSLVNELLDISKLESHEMQLQIEEIQPLELAQGAISHVQGLAQSRSIVIEINIPTDLPLLRVDTDLIRRVLINLLGNALKFAQHQIVIEASVNSSADGNAVLLFCVKDDGEGIAPEDQERISQNLLRLKTAKPNVDPYQLVWASRSVSWLLSRIRGVSGLRATWEKEAIFIFAFLSNLTWSIRLPHETFLLAMITDAGGESPVCTCIMLNMMQCLVIGVSAQMQSKAIQEFCQMNRITRA